MLTTVWKLMIKPKITNIDIYIKKKKQCINYAVISIQQWL